MTEPADRATASGQDARPLVYVCDASAEANRLSGLLRERGFRVADVPLNTLVARSALQRPALVLCDADAQGALDAIGDLRSVAGGSAVEIVFLGASGGTLDTHPDRVLHEASAAYHRPTDGEEVVRKVEALVGRPSRVPPPESPRRFSSRPAAAPSSSPPRRSVQLPPAPPRSAMPALFDADRGAADVAPASLSADLQSLLAQAEERWRATAAPHREAEPAAEAHPPVSIPPEILAALEEPLAGDEGGGSVVEPATGSGSGSGSGAGNAGGGRGTSAGTGVPADAVPGADAEPAPAPAPATVPPEAAAPAVAGEHEPDARPAAVTPPPPRRAPEQGAAARTEGQTLEIRLPRISVVPREGPTEPPPASPALTVAPPPRTGTAAPWPATAPPPVAAPVLGSSVPPARAPALPSPRPGALSLPPSLGPGDALRAVAAGVRQRFTGSIAFEEASGLRRVVFRDGDFVTAVSTLEAESLVGFLVGRGALKQELLGLARKLPPFGRHCGAALIAHGHLHQDDLWPTLRAHAEWTLGRVLAIASGAVSVESTVPPRLEAEPAVFGGATGAEVLVELVRRTVTPAAALAALGGGAMKLVSGPAPSLLTECALPEPEQLAITRSLGGTLAELAERAPAADILCAVLALCRLGVVDVQAAPARAPEAAPPAARAADPIDDDAIRAAVAARRALVEEGDYFAVLGVERDATAYEVRRAWQELRRSLDPSLLLTPATAELRPQVDLILEVAEEAYDLLRDDARRERYRRALAGGPR